MTHELKILRFILVRGFNLSMMVINGDLMMINDG
jgi:hypothetical protein